MASDATSVRGPSADAGGSPSDLVRLLLGAVLAGCLVVLALAGARHEGRAALHGAGEQGLLAGVLAITALALCVLCTYLSVIWLLAAAVLVLGPRSAAARPALGALRVLAPGLARRVLVSAALLSTATALGLGPAGATSADGPGGGTSGQGAAAAATSRSSAVPEGGIGTSPAARSALRQDVAAEPALTGADGGTSDDGTSDDGGEDGDAEETTDPAAARPGGTAQPIEDPPSAPTLPPLGWGEDAPVARPGIADEQAAPAVGPSVPVGTTEDPPEPGEPAGPGPAAPPAPRTVVVGEDDCLWTITDDLLGEGPDDVVAIDRAWPLLYAANRDRIGPDPDHVETGTVLVVPDSLTGSGIGAAPTQERP